MLLLHIGLVSGYLELRSLETSNYAVRNRVKSIEHVYLSDDDSYDSNDHGKELEKRQTGGDNSNNFPTHGVWNSLNENQSENNCDVVDPLAWEGSSSWYQNCDSKNIEPKKDPNRLALYFKKDVCPGVIIGPPLGGKTGRVTSFKVSHSISSLLIQTFFFFR